MTKTKVNIDTKDIIINIQNNIKKQNEVLKIINDEQRKIKNDIVSNTMQTKKFINNNLKKISDKEKEISEQLNKTRRHCCCYKLDFSKRINEAILEINDLSRLEKVILRKRYIKMIEDIERDCKRVSVVYNLFKFMIQTGSLVIPAILSIQHFYGGDAVENPLYWTSWGTSIGVGLLTNYVGIFKIDQKFYKLNTLMEKLKIEGWEYVELSGKYSEIIDGFKPTHKNKFTLFCHQVEKMKKHHIEIEYTPQQISKQTDQNGKPIESSPIVRRLLSNSRLDILKKQLEKETNEEEILKLEEQISELESNS